MLNITDKIIRFEDGEMEMDEVIQLFSELIKNGMAYTLQGSYGRTANALIMGGYLNAEGEIINY